MREIKIFDVVKLNNRNKATILGKLDANKYKVELVNEEGKIQGIEQIDEKDIIEVIFAK